MIWLTSDLHLNHNREFIYAARGFKTVDEMNYALLNNINTTVNSSDDLYILGDLMLGGAQGMEAGIGMLSAINARVHIVRGNHDSDMRWKAYSHCWNVVEIDNAIYLKYKGHHFFLSHFPTFTANLEKETLKQCTINLYGHTHQNSNFYNDIPFMYHVGVDSHECKPISLDRAIEEMYNKMLECRAQR